MQQEHNAESGSANGGEVDKKDRVAIFAHEWPMDPASFINYVSGHGVCPDTLEVRLYPYKLQVQSDKRRLHLWCIYSLLYTRLWC